MHCIVGYELIDNFAATLSAARKPAQVRLEKTFLLPASVIRILGRQGRERRPSLLTSLRPQAIREN